MIMGKEDYERIIGKLRERAEKMEGVVNPLMTRLGVDYLGMVLPTVSAIIAERDRLKKYKRFVQHIQAHLRPDQHVICKICGKSVDEIAALEDKPCTLKDGEEARLYLESEPMVGTKVIYFGVLHEVIDAGLEQGRRLAAVKEDKP